MPCSLLSPDLSTCDLFSVLDERVATDADGRLGQPARGARGRAVIAQLPWASGSRGIPPAAGPFLVTHSTPPGLHRGEQLGEDGQRRRGAAAYSRPPGSAEPKHSSATCNSTTHRLARATSQGPARELRCDPMGRRELAIEAGLVVRWHNARTGDWCSRPSWSRSCATDDS